MDEMRRVAFECVGRAFAFALLAIGVTMIGLSFNLRLAFQTGAVLFGLTGAILMLLALRAPSRHYKRTEVWLWLAPEHRPPESHAQWATGLVLQETYNRFASHAWLVAAVLAALAVLLSLLPARTGL